MRANERVRANFSNSLNLKEKLSDENKAEISPTKTATSKADRKRKNDHRDEIISLAKRLKTTEFLESPQSPHSVDERKDTPSGVSSSEEEKLASSRESSIEGDLFYGFTRKDSNLEIFSVAPDLLSDIEISEGEHIRETNLEDPIESFESHVSETNAEEDIRETGLEDPIESFESHVSETNAEEDISEMGLEDPIESFESHVSETSEEDIRETNLDDPIEEYGDSDSDVKITFSNQRGTFFQSCSYYSLEETAVNKASYKIQQGFSK